MKNEQCTTYAYDGAPQGQLFFNHASVPPNPADVKKIEQRLSLRGQTLLRNVQALRPELDWAHFLETCFRRKDPGQAYQGNQVLTRTFEPTIQIVTRHTGWELTSPEITFMTGIYFLDEAKKRESFLADGVRQIENGTRNFLDDNYRQKALENERNGQEFLQYFQETFGAALAAFGQQEIPDKQYQAVLQALALKRTYAYEKMRNQVMAHINEGNIEGAYEVIKDIDKQPQFK